MCAFATDIVPGPHGCVGLRDGVWSWLCVASSAWVVGQAGKRKSLPSRTWPTGAASKDLADCCYSTYATHLLCPDPLTLSRSAQPPLLSAVHNVTCQASVGPRNLSDFVYTLLQCDGQKPTCSPCNRRGTVCTYSVHTDMNIEERAELEQLRQQLEAPPRTVSGGGGGEEDLLHRLKTLPEHEAVTLLLQVRSGTRINQGSSRPQPGPVAPGNWVWSFDSRIRSNACSRCLQNLVTARNIPAPSQTSVEFKLMHRHHILYPVVTRLDPPEIQTSHIRILPYREHKAETTAGSSKYMSCVISASVIRCDPTGLGTYAVNRRQAQPSPNHFPNGAAFTEY